MNTEDLRITKLRDYLITVLSDIASTDNFQVNADFLGINDEVIEENYSINKIPTSSTIERWITGLEIHRDVYSLRSRKEYSQDVINNLMNIGFFEQFENIIKSNNKNGVLPEIEGIQSIECLNCGTLNSVDGTTATFDIQIQITYMNTGEVHPTPSM